MPQIEIRTALATDIPYLPKIDHHSVSETVWKMAWAENGGLGATFQPAPLPRPLKLPYPHDPQKLLDTWQRRGLLLVAVHDGLPIGYLAAEPGRPQHGLWLTDVVVHAPWRRKGIGSALVLTAGEWGSERGLHQMVLEASFRNGPAIAFAQHLGFTFSGFQYGYYPNGDVALFFALSLT
jgi:GNAT superfamily N-acetyltransferase